MILMAISLSIFGIIYNSEKINSKNLFEFNGRIYETDSANSYYMRLADKTEKDFWDEAVGGEGIGTQHDKEYIFKFRQILRKSISKERRKELSARRIFFDMVFLPDMSVAAIRLFGNAVPQLNPEEIDMIDSSLREVDFKRYLYSYSPKVRTKPFHLYFPSVIDTFDVNDRSILYNYKRRR